MNIISVTVFALLACFAGVILKNLSQPIAKFITVTAIICIIGACIVSVGPIFEFIEKINEVDEFADLYTVMLKGLGIAILSETASDICKECGESSLGSKVEMAAKISMIILSLPILNSILGISKEMMMS